MSWAEACVYRPLALLELYRELRGASEAPYGRYEVERRHNDEGTQPGNIPARYYLSRVAGAIIERDEVNHVQCSLVCCLWFTKV